MANVDRPNGFKPFGCILRVRPYRANEALKEGDAVNRVAGTTDSSGRSSVEMADASEAIIGIVAHKCASGDLVLVYDHPDQEFVVQADGADINEGADIGKNYDLLATVGSSDWSAHELDSSTGDTTAALPLKLLRILPAVDNALGAQVKCVVKINNHQLASGTGVVGV
jgi:hypothetical protein